MTVTAHPTDSVRFLPDVAAVGKHLSEIQARRSLLPDFQFEALPQFAREFLKESYGLSDEEIARGRLMWITNKKRLWCPIYTMDKRYVGGVSRLIDKSRAKTEPKALTCVVNPTYGTTAFYIQEVKNDKDEIWLVEDQYSAMRLSSTVNAAALLGTNISESLIENLLMSGVRNVTLCLDKDASFKAMKYHNKYGQLFTTFKVAFPPRDIKNMSENELDRFIYLDT